MKVVKLGEHFGAEIRGVDLTQLDDETFEVVAKAFFENQVVVFRDQHLSPEQQVAFTRRFGELEQHVRKESRRADFPEILVVSNIVGEDGKPIGSQDAGRFWHSDLSYKATPSLLSALYSIEVPRRADGRVLGDTGYRSVVCAYDGLSSRMQARLEGLRAVHSYRYYRAKNRAAQKEEAARGGRVIIESELTEEQLASVPDVAPLMVRVHPVTGRKGLFVNEAHVSHIVGLPAKESDALLEEIYAHIERPEYAHTHRWQENDLLMWDNVALQHKATFDYDPPLRRLMLRTTVRGPLAL